MLDSLRAGRFFVTTGEVLIPEFTVNGQPSGSTVAAEARASKPTSRRADWTFPLRFAELISGDGSHVFRERIDLSDTGPFDSTSSDALARPDRPQVGPPGGLGHRRQRRLHAAGLAG